MIGPACLRQVLSRLLWFFLIFTAGATGSQSAAVTDPAVRSPDADSLLTQQDELTALVEYFALMRLWNADAQLEEFNRVQRSFRDQSDETTQLRLALLHLIPKTDFYNEQRARSLLDDYRKNGSSKQLKAFANFVYALLDQRHATRQLLRKLQHEQEKRRYLENKLDAMKAIEQNINQRDKPDSLPSPDAETIQDPAR